MAEIYGQFVGEGSYRPSEMGRRYVGEDPREYPAQIMTTNHGQGDEFFYADSEDAYRRWRQGTNAYPQARQSGTGQTAVQREAVPARETVYRDAPNMGRVIDITDGRRGAMGGVSISDRIRPVGPQQSGYTPFSNLPEAGRGTPSEYYPEESIPQPAPRYVSPFEMPEEYAPQSLRRELWDSPVMVSYRPERLVPAEGKYRMPTNQFPYTLDYYDDTKFGPMLVGTPNALLNDAPPSQRDRAPTRSRQDELPMGPHYPGENRVVPTLPEWSMPKEWIAPDLYQQASSSGWGYTPRRPERMWG